MISGGKVVNLDKYSGNVNQEVATKARKAKIRLGKEKYRRFLDEDLYWSYLAKSRGLGRLPMWHVGPETSKMREWLKKLKITQREYYDWFGYKSLKEFAELNPEWCLRAWIGLLLEYLEGKPRELDNPGEI